MYPWHYETTVSRFLLTCQERVKKSDSDSEVHGIKKFLKSDEGNSLSSREPSVITEGTRFHPQKNQEETPRTHVRVWLCLLQKKLTYNYCSNTEQTTVTTNVMSDVQGKAEVTTIFNDFLALHKKLLLFV